MAIKLKKTLYVGVGGTGVATLLKVKKCFFDSYGEIPPMIGFLAIDTDGSANNKSVTGSRGEMISLAQSELLVCSVRGALQIYKTNKNAYDWVPSLNVRTLSGIQGGGAGQVRSNGRFIAYFNKNKIDTSVSAAVNKINALIPQGSKYEADVNKDGIECYINVVGSIAGGTGSGMMIDVLCIIREALKNKKIRLCPWIVLPEVFRAMATGPSMANVLYNTYGALKELDYLMHYDPKAPAINFGYARIDESLFDYAYVINNTNSEGVSFNSLDDITDVMAKSMFLPANKMGDEISTPFDNILIQRGAGTYDILNKKAWAATTSSSELIYDSQAVGRVYAYRTIEQLCTSMLQSPEDGSADANRFVDDPDVLIRENEGKDDVINALLSPGPEYMLEVDKNTTQQDIDTYIANNCDETRLAGRQGGLNDNFNNKLNAATAAFDKYIAEIMGRQQGKVDAAIKFVEALKVIMSICKNEMAQEGADYHAKNSIPVQWDFYLNAVTNRGIKGILKPINEEAIEALQYKLSEEVTNRREEIRRNWALKFYNKFETNVVATKLQKLNSLSSIISGIAGDSTKILINEKQKALSTSNFQIFLHKDDVDTASRFTIDDQIKADFVAFLGNGMSSWIGQSKEDIEKKLWDFAKGTDKVKDAVNTDIDTVLRRMKEGDVKARLDRLKLLASPLWTYNTHGFASTAQQLDSFVVVGVGNRDTSILKTDAKYNTFFNIGENKTLFASTNQDDRVYVLVVEDLLPIYAVNNFKAYEYDHQMKVSRGAGMANYLDEKLNNRMNAENFSLMPVIEADNVLEYWVMGFVFDLIHFDKKADTYWIHSKSKGDPLKKNRFDLNKSRDVAYDMFKSEQLYKEVEETLNAKIAQTGQDPIDARINAIKADGTYYEEVSQLSPLERQNIYNSKFRPVRELVEQEIKLMTV